MPNKTPREIFPIITALTDELSALNACLEITTKSDSICLGRIQFDKPSNQNMLATSCIKEAKISKKKFYIVLVEQHSLNVSLDKYSFQVTDKNRVTLKQYDRDKRFGSHIHFFANGRKMSKHIPFSDSIKDVAKDINHLIENIVLL